MRIQYESAPPSHPGYSVESSISFLSFFSFFLFFFFCGGGVEKVWGSKGKYSISATFDRRCNCVAPKRPAVYLRV